jgi:hypothetical protein
MNDKPHSTKGVVFGLRPGTASGVAILRYNGQRADAEHPGVGYSLRGYIVTNLTPDHLRTWIYDQAAAHEGKILVALSKAASPSAHIDRLLHMVGSLGVKTVYRPVLATDVFCSDRRIRAAYLDHVIARRPLVRLATNQALYAAIHDWHWPDPLVLSDAS